MIRTLIFDLGRVLIPFDFRRGYARMSVRCGLPPEDVRQRLRASGLVHEFESGRIAPEDFVARVTNILKIDTNYDDFCEIWSSIFLPVTLIPESFIEVLRRRYRTVLLSNTNSIHYDVLRERYPILRHFDARTLSFEVKAMKPEPAIYRDALEKAECRPEECFYTDDIEEYVAAARAQGIDAVQFHGYEQLRADLLSRGVSW